MSTLFRQAAVDARLNPLVGATRLARPAPFAALAGLALAVVAALVWLVACGRLAQTTHTVGYVNTAAGQIAVFAPRTGVLRELRVANGDQVLRDQPLAVLGPAGDQQRIRAMLRELHNEERQLDRQLDAVAAEFESRARDLTHRLAAARARLAADVAGDDLLLAEQELAAAAVDRIAPLAAGGFAPRAELDAARRLLLGTRLRQADRAATAAEVAARAEGHRLALDGLPATRRAARARLEQARSGARRRRLELLAATTTTIRATRAGTVAALGARAGERITDRAPLLVIAPAAGRLRVDLLVSGTAAGRIRAGAPVGYTLRGSGPGSARRHVGRVLEVPRAPVAHYRGRPLAEPVFLVVASLDTTGHGPPELVPGMPLAARIRHADRRLVDWLVAPAQRLLHRMTEPAQPRQPAPANADANTNANAATRAAHTVAAAARP